MHRQEQRDAGLVGHQRVGGELVERLLQSLVQLHQPLGAQLQPQSGAFDGRLRYPGNLVQEVRSMTLSR